MGNSSMTSSSIIMSNISSNNSLGSGAGHAAFDLSFSWSLSFTEVISHCHVLTANMGWFGVKLVILLTALPANTALVWMLLHRKKAMTPSEVLGLNVSIMDLLCCLILPLDIYTAIWQSSDVAYTVSDAFFAFSMFGCPLLLTTMCVERYMAAAHPIVYMTLGRWEYRAVLCACAWSLSMGVALCRYFMHLFTMVLYLAATISALFLTMLLCLLGIVRVLRQSGLTCSSGSNTQLKRRALKNVVAVIVPSVVAYSPLLVLVPYMIVIVSKPAEHVSAIQCCILRVLLAFPNVGLYIGPTFYLSRLTLAARCCKDSRRRADQM